MAQFHTLKDEFNGTAAKTLWSQFTAGSATMTYDTTGALTTFPATTSSSTDGDISTVTTYSLLDSCFHLNILAIPASGATTSSGIVRLQITSANFVGWHFNVGNILAVKRVASADSTLFTAAWSATTHAWIRIREANGTTYWDTSTDGQLWTNRWSEADPIVETGLTAVIGGLSSGVDSSPGTFKWNDLNISTFSKPGNRYRAGVFGTGSGGSEAWT
jgi:hypothetical protein